MRPAVMLLLLSCTQRVDLTASRDSPDPEDSPQDSASVPEDIIVLHGGSVVLDGSLTLADVWLSGETVIRVTTDPPPQAAPLVDISGKYVVAGLVDAHVHLAHSGATVWTGDPLAANVRASLYHGVTAVYDLGGPEALFALRDSGILAPQIRATGPFLTAPGSHPCESAVDPELCIFVDADSAAKSATGLRSSGADAVKVALADADFTDWPTPRLDLEALAAITSTGPTLAHVDENEDLIDALAAGVNILAHPVFSGPPSETALSMVNGVGVHSTLGAFAAVGSLLDGTLDLDDSALIVGPGVIENWRAVRANPEVLEEGWAEASAEWAANAEVSIVALHDAGAVVLPGSDAGYYFVPHGSGLHAEMHALVALGWTPAEVLEQATDVAREQLSFDPAGPVAGRRADLVIVQANPLDDIRALDAIDSVVLGGVVYAREDFRTVDLGTGEGFCLGNECACDPFTHTCVDACDEPTAITNPCGPEAYCLTPGVCHTARTCDLYAQDCEPAYYAESCVPFDADTASCWPSGPRLAGQTCSWEVPDLRCEVGAFCSWVDARCYTLCDPDDPLACPGRCAPQESAPGVPWFGVCL